MEKLAATIRPDQLTDLLLSVRFQGTVFCRSELSAPWGFAVVRRHSAAFHLVTRGRCCLDVDGIGERFWLSEGDLVILPTGSAHTLRDRPTSPVTHLDRLVAEHAVAEGGTLRAGGGGAESVVVCGGFAFDEHGGRTIFAGLPPIIHLRAGTHTADSWLGMTLAFLAAEADSRRPGAEAVMIRLADLLFIEAVRTHFSAPGSARSGLAAAIRDPRIATALASIHRQPEADWSISRLASQAAMSRAGFADRFKMLVGESPFAYVTRCRMAMATSLLSTRYRTVSEIAARVGYRSEASFGRAFKRSIGISPATYRRNSLPRPSSRARAPTSPAGTRAPVP
jgi:AraC-like DNA-binding protein/mannose-6-phosphate isomerase-like protein (cupin superfamily)